MSETFPPTKIRRPRTVVIAEDKRLSLKGKAMLRRAMGALALLGGAVLAGSFLAQASGERNGDPAASAQVPDSVSTPARGSTPAASSVPGATERCQGSASQGQGRRRGQDPRACSNRWTTIAGER